jgi:SNF2 family DNA or RNA helicase
MRVGSPFCAITFCKSLKCFVAHVIRNWSSQVFHAVNTLHARHRWCLTGTPIQNRVEDLGALVGFLRVYPFDNPTHFRAHFVSSMPKGHPTGIEKVKALFQAIALRRTKKTVFKELELRPRVNKTEPVELSTEEMTLYNMVKRSWNYGTNYSGVIPSIFQTITKLRQICNHGRELLSSDTLAFLDQGMINRQFEPMSRETQSCENCGVEMQDFDLAEIADTLLLCLHLLCNKCLPKTQDNTEESLCPVCAQSEVSDSVLEDELFADPTQLSSQRTINVDSSYCPSSKVLALLQNLRAERLQYKKDPIKR